MPVLSEYEKLYARHLKGAAYLDNPYIPLEERQRWIPEYKEILNRLNELYNQIKEQKGGENLG